MKKSSLLKNGDLIEFFREFASKKKGKCLSNTYINSQIKMKWSCEKGHIWEAPSAKIKAGSWCPDCAKQNAGNYHKLNIDFFVNLAKKKGGKCLSQEYQNAHQPLRWQCADGHTWEAPGARILGNKSRKGNWCPYCSGRVGDFLEEYKKIAIKKEGRCVSKKWVSSFLKLKFKCKNNHVFEMLPSNVKKGQWCSICSGRKEYTINDCLNYAKSKNGDFISKAFKNAGTKYEWKCGDCNSVWKASLSALIANDSWCRKCAMRKSGADKRLDLGEFKELAKKRGGKCLSEVYEGLSKKLLWECKFNHRWESSAGSIKNGTWCPTCSEGLGERICRYIFENLTGKKFTKIRPEWLRKSSNSYLELDGYNEELQIAFEHQGEQHFSTRTQFIKSKKLLKKRIEVDKFKVTRCKERGIHVIVVPEINKRLSIEEAVEFIYNKLHALNVNLLRDKLNVHRMDFYYPEKFFNLQKIVSEREGVIITKSYLGSNSKMIFQCKNKHQWEAVPSSIMNNKTWCPFCSGNIKRTIQEMQELAISRGGRCLSKQYTSANVKLDWECKNGHRFSNSPSKISSGQWCKKCAMKEFAEKMSFGIEFMQIFAHLFKGECLSETYKNNMTPLKWKCNYGHTWSENFASLDSKLKLGRHFCPKCDDKITGYAQSY